MITIGKLFVLFLCLFPHGGNSQPSLAEYDTYRKHFLVCLDKTILQRNQSNKASFSELLSRIFNSYEQSNIDDQSLLFNPDSDQISIFTYGIKDEFIKYLRENVGALIDKNDFHLSFSNRFVKKYPNTWAKAKASGESFNINRLLDTIEPQEEVQDYAPVKVPIDLISLAILDNTLDNTNDQSYSEVYYLLILTASDASTIISEKHDSNDYRNLFQDNECGDVTRYAAETIHDKITIEKYKEFSYTNEGKTFSCLIYSVRPPIEAMEIESDTKLYQEKYKTIQYRTSSTRFILQSPVEMEIDQVALISRVGSPVGSVDYSAQSILDYSLDRAVGRTIINVKKSKVEINSYKSGRNDDQTLNYLILCQYPINNSNLPFVMRQHILIQSQDIIDLKYDSATIFKAIIVLIFLGGTIYLYKLGQPLDVTIIPDSIMDSIVLVDKYDNNKSIEVPYIPQIEITSKVGESKLRIKISGTVKYKYQQYPFNWKTKLSFILETKRCPETLRVSLEKENEAVEQEFSELEFARKNYDVEVSFNPKENKYYEIFLIIDQDHDHKLFKRPSLVELEIQVNPYIQKNFKGAVNAKYHPLKFAIGPTLSPRWIGIDPGTSGSCVASGDSLDNIMVEHDDDGRDLIIPSMVVFKTDEPFVTSDDLIPENVYEIGHSAKIISNLKNNVTFRSIKKMLGYNNTFKISFPNSQVNVNQNDDSFQDNRNLEVSGTTLTSLLLRGIINQHGEALAALPEYGNSGSSNSGSKIERAVIAIPNNFTSSKLRQLDSSLDLLNRYQEKRYIYESEAVFMYYLFNKNLSNYTYKSNETVMIFDFGGATINISLIKYNSFVSSGGETSYELDLLSKLGYAIGGDTIDYCILKSIFDYSEKYELLSKFNPFLSVEKDSEDFNEHIRLRRSYMDLALNLKKEIIKNYYDTSVDYLLEPADLEYALNDIIRSFGNSQKDKIRINKQDPLFQLFTLDSEQEYPLFANKYFQELIYDNIHDACQETISIQTQIETVIFSGRSTLFPNVKETVTKVYSDIYHSQPKIETFGDDSFAVKSLVAKGACIYGIAKDSIKINNKRSLVHYGVALRKDPTHIEYIPLVKPSDQFKIVDNTKLIRAEQNMNNTFSLDNHLVKFYQVMGQKPQKIFNQNQKHKYSLIQRYYTSSTVQAVGLDVYEDENITCKVKNQSHEEWQIFKGTNTDPEISEENDEHYTWIIQ